MGSESLLGAWGVRRAASAGSFPATQAAGAAVQSRRTRRRKSGLCGRGRVGSRMRFGQLSSCGSKRVGLQSSSVDAPSWRDVQWCARSRSTSISIATPRPAATCGPAFLALGASAAGAARAKQGRGRGKIPNQRMIDTRPAEVETRKSVGHWEGDLINGARETGHLSTLVERCTRYIH